MTDRRHYWNEDTQSWEDGPDRGRTHAATPPPPPRSDLSPPRSLSRRPDAPRPPTARPATPPALGEARRRLLWPVVGAVAVVAVATPLALVRPFDGDKSDSAAPSAAPSAPVPDAPADPGPADPPEDAPPDGYRLVEEAEGFSAAVPEDWDRAPAEQSAETFEVDYDKPGVDGAVERFLRITDESESLPERPFADARESEGFEELAGPEPFEEEHLFGQRMEYLLREGETTWYVVDTRFEAADGNLYGVAAYGSDNEDLTDERTVVETALRHFCPSGTTCGDEPNTL